MTIAEIKAKVPEAEVYALDENARYLLVASRMQISYLVKEELLKALPKGSLVLLVADVENAVRLLEIKE